MNNSPETSRSELRRTPSEMLARILAEGRRSRRRLLFGLGASALLLWVLLANAVESSQALRFRLVDPWPAEQPALWMPAGGHVQRLEAAVGRLRACVRSELKLQPLRRPSTAAKSRAGASPVPAPGEGEVLAISPDPRLGPQGLYWSLWVISLWPEQEIRLVGADGEAAPAHFLIAGSPRADLELLCSAQPLRLYRLGGER